MPKLTSVCSIGSCLIGFALAGGASAQGAPAPFCAAVGEYMHDIAARRAAGSNKDDAVAEVAPSFDAFASDAQDLANRRRVLANSDALATFAFDLADLAPETVQVVGEAYCLSRGGDVSLAPSPARAARMAANARECGEQSPAPSACVTRAVEDVREVRVASESAPEVRGRPRIEPFYEFGLSVGGDTLGTVFFVNGTREDIDAGYWLSAGGGMIQRVNDKFGIKYSAAYKLWPSTATNVSILKTALTVDIVPYIRSGDHRFGFGVSHHFSPKVDWDGLLPTDHYDDATGPVVEYAYKYFSFSYTDMDYEAGASSFDASHFGFRFSSRY